MDSRGSHPPDAGGTSPVATPVQERTRVCGAEETWRFRVPAVDTSVPELRHAVRDLLARQGRAVPEEAAQNALLILSELATNAVQHAAVLSPEMGIEVTLGGGRLRVAVEDGHPYRPKALACDPDSEETGGRGLMLVKLLTSEAGGACDVEPTGAGGKVVWASLPLTSRRPLL